MSIVVFVARDGSNGTYEVLNAAIAELGRTGTSDWIIFRDGFEDGSGGMW